MDIEEIKLKFQRGDITPFEASEMLYEETCMAQLVQHLLKEWEK